MKLFVGMEAVHPPIVRDAIAPLILEKKVGTGIVRERGNIVTRKDIAHAPTLTGTKGRGVAFKSIKLNKASLGYDK